MMGLGTQHAVALTKDGTDTPVLEVQAASVNGSAVPQDSPAKPSTPARPPI